MPVLVHLFPLLCVVVYLRSNISMQMQSNSGHWYRAHISSNDSHSFINALVDLQWVTSWKQPSTQIHATVEKQTEQSICVMGKRGAIYHIFAGYLSSLWQKMHRTGYHSLAMIYRISSFSLVNHNGEMDPCTHMAHLATYKLGLLLAEQDNIAIRALLNWVEKASQLCLKQHKRHLPVDNPLETVLPHSPGHKRRQW